jgi:hypothetical protein
VLERHLALPHALRDGAVTRVEALEAGLAVVVPVGVVEVEHQLAAQLHLVGRVVREEPRGGRVAQAELEQRGRRGEQHSDREHQRDARPARHHGGAPRQQEDSGGAAQERGHERGRPRDPEVPLLAGGADERGERPLRIDAGRPEAPRVRPELRKRDRHQREQHSEERPCVALGHAAAGSRRRAGSG